MGTTLHCASYCGHGCLRRQAAKRELGLAYGLEDDQAKFSQAEVNAKIRER